MDASKRRNEADLADLRRSSRPNKGFNPKYANGEETMKRKNRPKGKATEGRTQRHGEIQEDESGSGSIVSELFLFGSENLRMGRKNSSKASSMRRKKTTSSIRKERLRLIAEIESAEAERKAAEAERKAAAAEKILAEKRLQFQMLEETEEEDDNSEEEFVENPEKSKNYMENWLEKLSEDKEKDVKENSSKIDGNSQVEKATSHISEENENMNKAPSCKSCCGSKEENSHVKVIETLVSGFTDAIKMLSAKPAEDSSNKIIARQAMGRELPSFTGNPEEWPNFISEYKRTTKDCSYTNIENMLRLRKCLHGEAKQIVNSMLIIPVNVDLVIHGCASSLMKSIVDKDFTYTVRYQNEEWQELNDLVKESFSTDAFGVKTNLKTLRSKEDERAICIMENTAKRIEDRWETGLLWRSDEVNMPKSKPNAFHRLKIMERKMDNDPNFAKQYCEKICDYVKKNYAKKLSKEESAMEDKRTFYLPHFGAFHSKKPGKLRFVFDAAAKCNEESLNDKLIKDGLIRRKQWKITQRLADHFWQRWIKEYLPTLRKRPKWHENKDPVKVGDIVIVVDDTMTRNCWPKGIIEQVYPGADGQVRVVDVRTSFGVFRRPTLKICVLDVKPAICNEP